jgi:hypothetical protein
MEQQPNWSPATSTQKQMPCFQSIPPETQVQGIWLVGVDGWSHLVSEEPGVECSAWLSMWLTKGPTETGPRAQVWSLPGHRTQSPALLV